MPELPEVETVVRGLRRTKIHGVHIQSTAVHWARTLDGMTPDAFAVLLCGKSILQISRRAKYIKLKLSDGLYVLIHLRMTGSLRVEPQAVSLDPYDRIVLNFQDGKSLRFRDTRKFGRWYVTKHPAEILDRLGPEPLSKQFSADVFVEMMHSRKRMLKPLLLDQTFLAGLGNIYVDEALFGARLHPCRLASSLSVSEVEKLHASIQTVLHIGVSHMGTSLGSSSVNFYSVAGRRGRNKDALQVFRRDGNPCHACGETIQRIIVGQRSTHICPHCQPAP